MTRDTARHNGQGERASRRRAHTTVATSAPRASTYIAQQLPASEQTNPPPPEQGASQERPSQTQQEHITSQNRTIRHHIGDASFLNDRTQRFGVYRVPRDTSQCVNNRRPASDTYNRITTSACTTCSARQQLDNNNFDPNANRQIESNIQINDRAVENTNVMDNNNTTSVAIPEYTITELPRQQLDQPFYMMSHSCNQTEMCPANSRPSDSLDCLAFPPSTLIPEAHNPRRHRRHRRRNRHRNPNHRRRANGRDDDYIKPCCSSLGCKLCLSMCLQFQKVLIFFASFGILCVLTGIILGVLRAPGNSFFTLSLMFVGLGLILLAMVLVGWKCTPADHEPCHMLFGLGVYSTLGHRDRRRRERLYWLGGMLYPEFRHRRPPPSYAAAMQDYRNELRRMSSHYVPGSPPPSYKSHTTIERPGIHIIFPRSDEFPNSNPPTYRQTTAQTRPSLAILNDLFVSHDTPGNRESVSSTQALVEAEFINETQTPTGIVNMSFDITEPQSAESSSPNPVNTNDSMQNHRVQSANHASVTIHIDGDIV